MRERELQRIHESFHRPSQNRLDLFSHCRQTTFLTSRASRLHCLLCCSFSAFASIVSFLHTIHLDKNHRRHYIVVSSNNDNISFMMMTTAISRTCTSSPLTRASYLPSLLTTPSTTATTTTAFLPPAQHDLNHASVQAVLDSWKNCRNSFQETHDFDEAFGKLLLIRVFALEPRIKLLFGFHVNIDPTATPLGEMALIMRAVRLTHQLHQVLEMLEKDRNALKLLYLELSRQRKDYLIKSRDIPLMGQALMHAVSTIMTNENDNKSDIWNDSLKLAWQQVIDAISFQIIAGNASSSSTNSKTSSTRRTRTCGGNPNDVKNNKADSSRPLRRLQPSSSMPLRQPLRHPSPQQDQEGLPGQNIDQVENSMNGDNKSTTSALVTREMEPRRTPLSPNRSFRNKKSSSRHHCRNHHYASTLPKAARVLVTKTTTTTTTTTTFHTTTTTTTAMSDSGSRDFIKSMEYNQDGSNLLNKNININSNNSVSSTSTNNNNDKKNASFQAMNYSTTTMDSESRHHSSSSLQASMGSYTKDSIMGRLSTTSRQECNFNMTRSSSSMGKNYQEGEFIVIPQAYFVVFPPPLDNNDNDDSDSSCSWRSFGAIQAVPETLLMHASWSSSSAAASLLPQTQHASQKKMNGLFYN